MKIYTRQGDQGSTRRLSGESIGKAHPLLLAQGLIDECTVLCGLVIASLPAAAGEVAALRHVQTVLTNIGTELSDPYRATITFQETTWLEQQIDDWSATLPPLTNFIPAGPPLAAAHAQLLRTRLRLTEHVLWTLLPVEPIRAEITTYLNRLSDWAFVLARRLAAT